MAPFGKTTKRRTISVVDQGIYPPRRARTRQTQRLSDAFRRLKRAGRWRSDNSHPRPAGSPKLPKPLPQCTRLTFPHLVQPKTGSIFSMADDGAPAQATNVHNDTSEEEILDRGQKSKKKPLKAAKESSRQPRAGPGPELEIVGLGVIKEESRGWDPVQFGERLSAIVRRIHMRNEDDEPRRRISKKRQGP